jgi:hypothetical protein
MDRVLLSSGSGWYGYGSVAKDRRGENNIYIPGESERLVALIRWICGKNLDILLKENPPFTKWVDVKILYNRVMMR